METIKDKIKQEKPGRGGRRSGAGRPGLGRDEEAFRAVTKSITLTREEWDLLASVAPSLSPSRGLSAALVIALDARCRPVGWADGGVLGSKR